MPATSPAPQKNLIFAAELLRIGSFSSLKPLDNKPVALHRHHQEPGRGGRVPMTGELEEELSVMAAMRQMMEFARNEQGFFIGGSHGMSWHDTEQLQ